MVNLFKRLSVYFPILLILSCAQITLVEPTARVTVVDRYTVEPSIAWSRIPFKNWERWTVDGLLLEALTFIEPVGEGESLVNDPQIENLPLFKADMTPLEVMDLFKATLLRMELYQVETKNLEPAEVDNENGFKFDFIASSKSGLDYRGFAIATIRSNSLYMFFYMGTKLYYFEKHKEDAVRVIKSIRFTKA